MIHIFTPKLWKEYQLIDCGDFEKLEKFGKYTLRRPEPQAVWKKVLSEKEWESKTDVQFKASGSHKGNGYLNRVLRSHGTFRIFYLMLN